MVKTKQQLVSSRKNTFKGTNKRLYITIHETANAAKGANAQAHANLQTNGFAASWHWTVDDKQAIQSFLHTVQCFHAGDGAGNGNLNSIGIEICVNSDGDYAKAVKNASELTRKIMAEENIPLAKVVQHHEWSGKNCPAGLRAGKQGFSWHKFISMVQGIDVGQASKPSKPKPSAPSKPTGKGDTKTTSIVTYLNSIGENSTYAHRSKLAEQHGIKGYVGTAAQNTKLLNLLRGESKPQTNKPNKPTKPATKKYKSIVDYLNDHNMGSSFSARKALASRYGIKNYTGSSAQNVKLLNLLQGNKTADKSKKSIKQMADEVAKGLHGNGNAERQKSLGVSNATYEKVRAEVNKRF